MTIIHTCSLPPSLPVCPLTVSVPPLAVSPTPLVTFPTPSVAPPTVSLVFISQSQVRTTQSSWLTQRPCRHLTRYLQECLSLHRRSFQRCRSHRQERCCA